MVCVHALAEVYLLGQCGRRAEPAQRSGLVARSDAYVLGNIARPAM
jgi:hypothetical protein